MLVDGDNDGVVEGIPVSAHPHSVSISSSKSDCKTSQNSGVNKSPLPKMTRERL